MCILSVCLTHWCICSISQPETPCKFPSHFAQGIFRCLHRILSNYLKHFQQGLYTFAKRNRVEGGPLTSSFQESLCFIAMASSPVGSFVARSHCPREINWLEWKKEILCPFVVDVMYELRKTSCYFSSLMYLLLSKDCWSCCLQRLYDLSKQLSYLYQSGTSTQAVLQPVRISSHHHPAHPQAGKWNENHWSGLCKTLVPGMISLYFSHDFCGHF